MDDVDPQPHLEGDSQANSWPEKKPDLKKPDFASLPVRMQVVLGQTELSLTALNGLGTGSIIELERSKNDPVFLAANGKLIGDGELVEVEGKLGVRITGWRLS